MIILLFLATILVITVLPFLGFIVRTNVQKYNNYLAGTARTAMIRGPPIHTQRRTNHNVLFLLR